MRIKTRQKKRKVSDSVNDKKLRNKTKEENDPSPKKIKHDLSEGSKK